MIVRDQQNGTRRVDIDSMIRFRFCVMGIETKFRSIPKLALKDVLTNKKEEVVYELGEEKITITIDYQENSVSIDSHISDPVEVKINCSLEEFERALFLSLV